MPRVDVSPPNASRARRFLKNYFWLHAFFLRVARSAERPRKPRQPRAAPVAGSEASEPDLQGVRARLQRPRSPASMACEPGVRSIGTRCPTRTTLESETSWPGT